MQQRLPSNLDSAGNAEVYDVFTKSVIYGIHSPWNHHSFKQTFVFLPQTCVMCHLTVYPSMMFTMSGGSNNAESGISCLRCHSFAHRKCIRKRTVICGSQVKSGSDNSILSTPSLKNERKVSVSTENSDAVKPEHSLDSSTRTAQVDWEAISERWDISSREMDNSSSDLYANIDINKELSGREETKESVKVPNLEEKLIISLEVKDWAAISEQWQSNPSVPDLSTLIPNAIMSNVSNVSNDIDTLEETKSSVITTMIEVEISSEKVDDYTRRDEPESKSEAGAHNLEPTYENNHDIIPREQHQTVEIVPVPDNTITDVTPNKTYGKFSSNIDVTISAASPILADIGSLIMVNLNSVFATTSAHMNTVSQNINSMRAGTFDRLRRSSFLNSSNTIEIVVNKYSSDVDFDSVLIGDSNYSVDLPIMNNESLPPPGSEKCIWRLALIRLFKSRKKSYILEDISDDMIEVQETVTSLLSGSRSFSNRVVTQLHSMYIDIVFDLPSDSLKHARECLDCICSAVLSQLPPDIINRSNSKDILRALTTSVDKYVLTLGYKNAMYNKSFSAALIECKSSDEVLIAQYSSFESILESEEQDMTIDIMNACDEKLRKVVQSTVASEKLGHLSHVLEIAASADISNPSTNSLGDDEWNSTSDESRSNERFIGADILLRRLRFLLKRNIHLHKTNWNAEIVYITAMLNDFNDIMLGKEGYSFVSLQQCVHSLNIV